MNLAPQEPEVLVFERSPFGNVDAIVEHDGRSIYFYLNGINPGGKSGMGTRACWLANLVTGPLAISVEELSQGIPPLMPRIHCDHPGGRELPHPDDLSFVWLEEGNGAAVYEKGEILGMLPPWSGVDGFHGYARHCIAQTEVAWPLPEDLEHLKRRLHHAHEFWEEVQNGRPFADLQSQQLELFEKRFGDHVNYWAIDGNKFPPRGMAQFQKGSRTTIATIGMSFVPQPNVELYTTSPSEYRRVEIGIQLDTERMSEPLIDQIGQRLSGLAQAPWQKMTWFGPRHTCEFPLDITTEQAYALFWPEPETLLEFRGDPVHMLWLVPISETEMEACRKNDFAFMEVESFASRLPVV